MAKELQYNPLNPLQGVISISKSIYNSGKAVKQKYDDHMKYKHEWKKIQDPGAFEYEEEKKLNDTNTATSNSKKVTLFCCTYDFCQLTDCLICHI